MDRRGLSDQCCQSVVGKHVSVKPACWEDPWERHEKRKKVRSDEKVKQEVKQNDAQHTAAKTKVLKCPLFYFIILFFVATIFRSACYIQPTEVETGC